MDIYLNICMVKFLTSKCKAIIYIIYIYIYGKSCIYIEFIIDIFSGIINRYILMMK